MAKLTPMHKRLAMGDTVKGYAKGGSIAPNSVGSRLPSIDVRSTGRATNPLTVARSANGIPGHKKGGKVCR